MELLLREVREVELMVELRSREILTQVQVKREKVQQWCYNVEENERQSDGEKYYRQCRYCKKITNKKNA